MKRLILSIMLLAPFTFLTAQSDGAAEGSLSNDETQIVETNDIVQTGTNIIMEQLGVDDQTATLVYEVIVRQYNAEKDIKIAYEGYEGEEMDKRIISMQDATDASLKDIMGEGVYMLYTSRKSDIDQMIYDLQD